MAKSNYYLVRLSGKNISVAVEGIAGSAIGFVTSRSVMATTPKNAVIAAKKCISDAWSRS
jgi:hypothetical protein